MFSNGEKEAMTDPACQVYWDEVTRQGALFEQAADNYDQAAQSLTFAAQQYADALETAVACEGGQLIENQERSAESPRLLFTMKQLTKALRAILKKR